MKVLSLILFFTLFKLSASDDEIAIENTVQERFIEKHKLNEFVKYPKNKKKLIRAYNFWENRNFNADRKLKTDISAIQSMTFDTLYPHQSWQELGPFQKPDKSLPAISGNGRVNVIEFDPNDSTIIWIGSAGGGVWKSEDSGKSWELSADTDFMSIGISDILISYDNSDIVYAATGDASGVPLFRGYSRGLIRTTDGGDSWHRIGDEFMLRDSIVISDIIQHPKNPEILFMSATGAIKKSTDRGDTWNTLKKGEWYRSMKMHPENPDILYAATFSHRDSTFIYRTKDGGKNWTKSVKTDTVVRTELAVTPAAPNHIYALSAHQVTGAMTEFIYSNDTGNTWQRISPHIDTLNLNYAQGFYNLTLMIDSKDTNKITAGGVFFYRTNDFGKSWIEMQRNNIHVDYHDFKYNSSDSALYIANDGGIYRLINYHSIDNDTQPIYEDISKGLGITQIYRVALNHRNDSLFFMGTQDNGTYKFDYGEYKHSLGADGMQCFVGNDNQNIVYTSDQMGNIYKSIDMGNTFKMIFKFHWQERKQWLRQFYVNPRDAHTVYAGYENIWRTYTGNQWEIISDFEGRETISAVNVSEADTNLIFAAKKNRLYKSSDNGKNFNLTFSSQPAISYIYSDAFNTSEYYFCMSGYVDSLKVFRSLADDKIENITYNLPNVPINSIIKNQMNGDIIIGTDAGIYALEKNSNNWKNIGKGFPKVIVNEVEILYGKGDLYAATFGRGLWKLNLWNCEIAHPEISHSGFIEICEDSSVKINYREASPANEYFWSDGRKSDTISINKDGEYYITAVSPEGCIAKSKKLKLKTYTKPILNLLLLSGNPVCEGEPVRLLADFEKRDTTGKDNYHYLWSNGDTTFSAAIYESGTYNLYVYSDKGCSYTTEDYEVIIYPKPDKPKIERAGKNLITNEGELIRWYRNGKMIYSGESHIIEIDSLGTYQAEVFDANFCSNMSDTFQIKIRQDNEINLNIYPNPFSNILKFEGYFDAKINFSYKIFDVSGKIIFKSEIYEIEDYYYEETDLSHLYRGLYFIEINANGYKSVFKIIRQ